MITTRRAPTSINKACGLIDLRFSEEQGHTSLSSLYQEAPLRLLCPADYGIGLTSAVLINTAGGVLGGDSLHVRCRMEPRARALITSPSAEKIYGSATLTSIFSTQLEAKAYSWSEWMPQETILCNGARSARTFTLKAEKHGQILAGEILIFGRSHHFETISQGALHDAWTVSYDNAIIWRDFLHLDATNFAECLKNPAGFNGARAYASLVLVAEDAAEFRAALQTLLENTSTLRSHIVTFKHLLIVKWLAKNPEELRRSFCTTWCRLRKLAADLPSTLPRMWQM